MLDPYGRKVTYLRVSVTDRCDLRCVYCMSENMRFLPRDDLLTLEEMERLCRVFVSKGVRKIRLTGGEPLVRHNVMSLVSGLGRLIGPDGLEELTLTTNGTQLTKHAEGLAKAGVRRLNVSLDTLDGDRFAAITRGGRMGQVLEGIMAAKAAGLAIKINTVALKGVNDGEYDRLVEWCGSHGFDLCLIETMPMGEIHADRTEQFIALSEVHDRLRSAWTLHETDYATGGPARYWTVAETGRRVGFITPMSHNFCESCNRVRVTCTGTLYMCLGQDDAHDLRAPLRADPGDGAVSAAIDSAIARKPKGHDFVIERAAKPGVARHMSVTGG
jgi:cyclic pyranopterin phosphate synthase